jgi:hypothetical protein
MQVGYRAAKYLEIRMPTLSIRREGNTGGCDIASTYWTCEVKDPPTCMEPSRARTGRPYQRPCEPEIKHNPRRGYLPRALAEVELRAEGELGVA